MVNRGEEKVWVQMNVVPRSTGNTNSGTRELTLKCKLKCYFKPMNNPLGVSPSKGKQGTRQDHGFYATSLFLHLASLNNVLKAHAHHLQLLLSNVEYFVRIKFF